MNIAQRIGTLTAVTLAAVAGTVTFASSANAEGTWQCSHWYEGTACARTVSGGYDVSWYKQPEADGGGAHLTEFWLECLNGYRYNSAGAFWISPYETRTYVFSIGSRGSCRAKVVDYTTSKTFYSSYAG
ncbi:hypothetical protein [Streptomyces triticiradicis]|uniref:Peptidase inhibitor family I36 protein n=1 Tax=Streptomyces triticiradicis TaxID=2651189 RepID=A0A7J5D1K8_9ACTN|nr:hypothetical protein [Streptomyces triticiradicis]KAB1976722.1 hypothetical protein F8144_43555 [Streptomyces triticiradicis]